MINPESKIAKSSGVDLPIMYVYLAGRIAGNCIQKCVAWRREIILHYRNYKQVSKPDGHGLGMISSYESYPIAFLDPLNSGEADSVDLLGLTSNIPPNLIYDKDELSVARAHVVVANVEDYFEEGILDVLEYHAKINEIVMAKAGEVLSQDIINKEFIHLLNHFNKLVDAVKNRRENFGTISEIAWALKDRKPLILIVPEARKEIYFKHPFAKRASVIVTSVNELLEKKWLNILYKSMAGAV